MAKRRVEPFNPWPSFVDLFASVIMVVLMFMLILIVNITYYAQFKYKVSYTGTVAINQTVAIPVDILEKRIQEEPVDEKKESVLSKEAIKIVKDDTQKELEAIAGLDLSMTSNNYARQDNILHEDWMAIKYIDSEVILDSTSIQDVDKFLVNAKKKFPQHSIWIYIKEPQNQISASVGKQIALSRVLNIRNMLRKRAYSDKDVTIKLRDTIPVKNIINHASGYAILTIHRKK